MATINISLQIILLPRQIAHVECHSSNSNMSFCSYMQWNIEQLEKRNKLSTAINYRNALKSFSSFIGNKDISFRQINETLISDYNDLLKSKNVVRNTISFYMRILRAVYNKAVKEGLAKQTFPFKNVYTGVDRTRKLAIDEDIIIKLMNLDLEKYPHLAFSRDLFIFSYCTRGMSFIDIAFLKKRDIANDYISYRRKKTGRLLTIRIEPCITNIIRRYSSLTVHSEYLFPLIKSSTPEEAHKQYQTALGYHNRKLKKLAEMIGISVSLSSYTPRHTWATVARNHNIPISVISAGLGHTSEKTTLIYLASLENSVINRANHKLLENLNTVIS